MYTVTVEVVGIGILRPSTITLVTAVDIILVMLVEVDIGHKIPSTLPLAIVEQYLMLNGEADIGIRTATLPPITQVTVVYC